MLHPALLRAIAAMVLSVTGVGWAATPTPARALFAQPLLAQVAPTLRGSQGSYTASVFVAVSAKRAWTVLTGYEAMAGVMPDIQEAHVLRRNGSVVELQQTYQAPYTFGRRIKAVLTMREAPPRQLSYTLVRGDQLRELRGSWTITPVRGGVQLRHQIQVDPVVPGFVRPLYFELMEANLRQSMAILKRLMEQG